MNQQHKPTSVKNSLIWLGLVAFFIYSWQSVIDFEDISNSGRQDAFGRILVGLSQPNISDGEVVNEVIIKMLETIQIAFLATIVSAILAIPFGFVISKPSFTFVQTILQLIFSVIRAVHPIITVILITVIIGIGATAGFLALTLFSTSVLIEKYTRYMQQHTELNWNSLVTKYFPAIAFKQFSTNAVNASILGFVGGGGIGFLLQQSIYLLNYHDASVSILAIIISISSLDLLSHVIWKRVHKTKEKEPS